MCRELISNAESYCNQHQSNKTSDAYNRDRYKHNKEYVNFYKSKEWLRVREDALKRDKYLCQVSLAKGIIRSADLVHHIIEVKDDWDKRLDLDNLQSVCFEEHNKIHKTN
ncbi:HNH endonuclease [Macrococcoides caseolyticum]|uniref:HNH endonuclease n=1 Tax=Macrococcoides caseolyticum TaxID=69966 RepID=UPI001F25FB9F|nr:HNH endonuclease [Macrococcus caseolyticus]MCE4957271.1 HNH endonuclease [Macrococcus caseolyticus]